MTIHTATYSPEDNKIRLYASARLDAETYGRVKAAGFSWAPKQELFVAPKWSPAREDLAIELAGEIQPEEMTLAERAAMKAERLDNLAHKKHREANAFHSAANRISERFAHGQPILAGHHSERKARRDADKMERAQRKANQAAEAANYWLYRATGVERHANHKNDPRVRAGRIKTLLAELRDVQRDINEANLRLDRWQAITDDDAIVLAIGNSSIANVNVYYKVKNGEWTPQEARAKCIEAAQARANSKTLARLIDHILNRLSFEREMLGPITRYQGELTPVILQAFAREHGAHKPEGKRLDDDLLSLESEVPLPLHLSAGSYMELSADEWRDLMQSVGYEVPGKGEALPPILNLRVAVLQGKTHSHWYDRRTHETFPVVEMTKAEYAAINSDYRGTRTSICGGFRFKIASIRKPGGPHYERDRVAVLLTDSKIHATPESYVAPAQEVAA